MSSMAETPLVQPDTLPPDASPPDAPPPDAPQPISHCHSQVSSLKRKITRNQIFGNILLDLTIMILRFNIHSIVAIVMLMLSG